MKIEVKAPREKGKPEETKTSTFTNLLLQLTRSELLLSAPFFSKSFFLLCNFFRFDVVPSPDLSPSIISVQSHPFFL